MRTALRADVTDRSVEELVFEAATGALADAGMTIADVDGIVLTAGPQARFVPFGVLHVASDRSGAVATCGTAIDSGPGRI